ncbi:hypothetical protein OENI_50010 [Oenococcus oeni]|nr:hypothetical protein OENI_50010 [Oenococcus oeni]
MVNIILNPVSMKVPSNEKSEESYLSLNHRSYGCVFIFAPSYFIGQQAGLCSRQFQKN